MYQLSVLETLLAAIALGIAFAFSFRRQLRLQQVATCDEGKAPLFARFTYAGLSLAIIFAAVLAGKISAFETYKFLAVVFGAVGATWLVFYVQRSNRQLDKDG